MEKNRRVEIFLREFIDPPPRPTPPPQPKPPAPPETGSSWSIQVLAGSTFNISTPTDLSSFTVILELEIIDKDRKQKACSSGKCFRMRSHCSSVSRIIPHL
jgi:hypothetical protein